MGAGASASTALEAAHIDEVCAAISSLSKDSHAKLVKALEQAQKEDTTEVIVAKPEEAAAKAEEKLNEATPEAPEEAPGKIPGSTKFVKGYEDMGEDWQGFVSLTGTYDGWFNKDGERHGQGTYTWVHGDVYKGGYKNGRYEGQGVLTGVFHPNLYEGEYKGAFKDMYEGEYKGGLRSGKGVFNFVVASDGQSNTLPYANRQVWALEGEWAEDHSGRWGGMHYCTNGTLTRVGGASMPGGILEAASTAVIDGMCTACKWEFDQCEC